ncbi:MAG: hypothetical protein IKG27_02495 [Bacilli bacterium]|nr:hypothetical protein [Bacilli bacterium]
MTKGNNTKKNKKKKINNEKHFKEETPKVIEEVVSNDISEEVREEKKQTIEKVRRDLHFEKNDSGDELSKLAKIVFIVTAIIIVFYFITTFVTRKANAINTVKKLKTDNKAEIQYESIIIGSMLKIDGNYYVLIENNDDEKIDEYRTAVQTIKANDEAPKIYRANLSNSFNKSYLAKESDYNSDLSKFKVKGTTLIKVSDHKIEKTYDAYDDIKGELDKLQ